MSRTDSRILSIVSSVAGIGAVAGAIGIGSRIHLPVQPEQLPGYARSIGLNPTTDVLRLLILFAFPLLAGAAVARLAPAWQTSRRRRFDHPILLAFSVFIIVVCAIGRDSLAMAAVVGVLAGAAAVALTRVSASPFSQNRLGLAPVVATSLLAWTFLAEPLGAIGWASLWTILVLVLFLVAEVLLIGRGDLESGATNLAVSSLAIPVALWGRRSGSVSLAIGIAVLALPLLASVWKKRSSTREHRLRLVTKFALLPGAVVALSGAAFLRVPPIADVFEDGHGLLPASEYLRGERAYRDIVPGHGFLSDGEIQAAALRVFGDDYVGLRRGMKLVGASFWPAVYFLGFAATGSAGVGFWVVLLTFLWFPQYGFVRIVASLAVLALACAAARTGRKGLWLAAGVAMPLSILLSVDFTLYAAAACVVAILVSRHGPGFALRGFMIGCLIGAAAVCLPFAIAGTLSPFLSTTFFDLARLMPVYALGFHVGFAEIGAWLSGWSAFRYREPFFGCVLVLAAFIVALLAARFPRLGARGRGLAPVLTWFFAAVMSVIERQHAVYVAIILPLTIVLVARWITGHSGWHSLRGILAAALLGALLICANLPHISEYTTGWLRAPRIPAGVVEIADPPRARGALFSEAQRTVLARTGEYLRSRNFGPLDTWLDFSNSPDLYYLFDRNCPIRYYEVPFYESESAQNEVITAVRSNLHVRAVLVHTGLWNDAIDEMSNFERAPRVAEFIRREFHPAYSKDRVEFWERNTLPQVRADEGSHPRRRR